MGVAPYGTGPMRAWGDACAEPNPNPRRDCAAPAVPPGPPGNAWKEESTPRAAWRARTARTPGCPPAGPPPARPGYAASPASASSAPPRTTRTRTTHRRRERVAFVGNASDPTGRTRRSGCVPRRNPRARALGRPGPRWIRRPRRAVSVPAGVVMPAAIPSATPEGVTLAPAARANGERWFPAYSGVAYCFFVRRF